MIKLPKTPVTVTLAAVMASKFALMSQGGFTDFVYSADILVTTVGLILLNFSPDIFSWLGRKMKRQKT